MSASFSRAMRTLQTENVRYVPWAMVGAAAILGGWLWWALGAQLPIYQSRDQGRLIEVAQMSPAELLLTVLR